MQEGLSQKLQNFEVRKLSTCPEVIPTLARWFEAEWGSIGDTYEYGVNWLTQAAHTQDNYPIVLVGFLAGRPVATGSILYNQIEEMPQYNPWLAYWYVTPENRGQGFHDGIADALCEVSRSKQIESVYLCTDTLEKFYLRRGWSTVDRVTKWGCRMAIMKLKI